MYLSVMKMLMNVSKYVQTPLVDTSVLVIKDTC